MAMPKPGSSRSHLPSGFRHSGRHLPVARLPSIHPVPHDHPSHGPAHLTGCRSIITSSSSSNPFVAMGIVTVFEWDLFFPDLLDLWVLRLCPFRIAALHRPSHRHRHPHRRFPIRHQYHGSLVLPAATDPPNLPRFLVGHLLAVTRRRIVCRQPSSWRCKAYCSLSSVSGYSVDSPCSCRASPSPPCSAPVSSFLSSPV